MSDFTIKPIPFPPPVIKSTPPEVKPVEGAPSFGETLDHAIQQVSALQREADVESQKLMTGEIKDIHSAMIAVQKADISFQMMMQVRNKIISAYQEIMRMQI